MSRKTDVSRKNVSTRPAVLSVGELRSMIADLPADLPVLVTGGPDHSYRAIKKAEPWTAGINGSHFSEWYGRDQASEGEEPIAVLVLD